MKVKRDSVGAQKKTLKGHALISFFNKRRLPKSQSRGGGGGWGGGVICL